MPIQTVCSSCSVKINIQDELIGKAIKCPKCGARFAVQANGDGATESVNAAQGAPSSDTLVKTDPVPSPTAQASDVTGDIASGSPPADPARALEAAPPGTEFLSTPDADSSATQAFPSTADAVSAVSAREAHGADAPQSLGGYRILREVGQGGMGAVYEAEDSKLNRRVALKIMKPEIAKNPQHRERFLREARTAAKVKSDFICPIYRVGEDDGVPFIAMPFLKGNPLDAHWKQTLRLPVDEVVRIGSEVAQGLKVAHDAGLVHRDIKPANIWLETQRSGPPRAMILDFGLARMQADDVHITQSGAIIGTPAFMSPEQARGDKHVDARTDLFSLGCVLYALCTGELPFQGDTTMGVLMALATHNPTPPHKISATTPKPLSRLIMRLLAKRPDDRPQTASEVIEELLAIDADHADPANGAYTTQVEAPLPPDTSADASEPNSRSAGKTATRRGEGKSVAAPSARMQTISYVLIGLIGVGLLGCVAPLAGGGLYFIFFADGKGADPKVAAEEGKAPDGKAPPDPTGEVPAGWVVVKSPPANYTVAMPQQPVNGPNGYLQIRLPNGTELTAMRQLIPRAQLGQAGGADGTLDQLMVNLLVRSGGLQPGAKIPEATKISLGQHKGRECRLMGKGPQGQPLPMYVRAYLIGNYLVVLTGSARGDAPAPETAAFFNSLKLVGRELDAVAEAKLPIHEVGQGLELGGKLDKQTPTLVYHVKLAAGKNYVIDMVTHNQPMLDPFLVLTDAAGKDLAEDDDSGGGLNARIVFRPEQTGTFRILATSFNFGAGTFTLTVREGENPKQQSKANPKQPKANPVQAQGHAARGDWKAAAAGYAKLFVEQPLDDGERGFEYAAVLLMSGDQTGYRKICAEMLDRSGQPSMRPYHVARACTLAPDSVKDAALPELRAGKALKGSRSPWDLTEQGALAYRAGRYDEARALLEQGLQVESRPGYAVVNWTWLSLVEHRRSKPAEARAWLEKTTKWFEQYPDGVPVPLDDAKGLHLHNWLEAQVLRREAEALLMPKK